MKIIYIAHPVAYPNKEENLQAIREIVRDLNLSRADIVPFAPYVTDCMMLDDTDHKQRSRGIANNMALLSRNFVNEIWLYGNRISAGMWQEIEIAMQLGIAIKSMTIATQAQLDEFMSNN
ncbi:hypothetical protein [Leeuwenhoekiella sp. LLG6367-2.1]|uniref:DUF7768 domain-containing protein n=1 Tax=Leeuwenhoekiella sp. LLG6367-2.1 TaxID=3160833 RepID=UPI003865D850